MAEKTYTEIRCSDEAEWLWYRNSGIGASEVPTVMGVNPFSDPIDLYARKIGAIGGKPQSEQMEWGQRLEDAVAKKYSDDHKLSLHDFGRYTILRSIEHPILSCTLDKVICKYEFSMEGAGVLEIKNINEMMFERYVNGSPHEMYTYQLQSQLAVTGWDWGVLAFLVAGQHYHEFRYDRNQAIINNIITETDYFWQRVLDFRPPAPTSRSHTTLQALYSTEKEESVGLSEHVEEMVEELDKIKASLGRLKTRKHLIENMVRADMGEATIGLLSDGSGYTWKREQRAKGSTRVLRRFKQKGAE